MSVIRPCPAAVWRKSSYSMGQDSCVEITDQFPGAVPIRDSKTPDGPAIAASASAWTAFVAAVSTGTMTARAR
ncbi:DUF397 domain-containing protein [Streptomyces luteireticuli]|uniref:DUF397 domain-containing protein n=1 Tax=Streptomyces luteireticuli TaxID=173858 RepID=A0ABN0Z5H4_9ACTN